MVIMPLLVTVAGLLTVSAPRERLLDPLNIIPAVPKVTVPVIETVPPLLVIPDCNCIFVLAPLKVPPVNVTKPVKSFAPVLFVSDKLPLVILVVPVVLNAAPPVVRVPPETVRLPLIVNAVVSVHEAVPPMLRFPKSGEVGVQVF